MGLRHTTASAEASNNTSAELVVKEVVKGRGWPFVGVIKYMAFCVSWLNQRD